VQDYVDITLKSTRYFNQTACVTLTLIKRLHVIWDVGAVPSLPAIGALGTRPVERGPSIESIYRVSLTVDLCEG